MDALKNSRTTQTLVIGIGAAVIGLCFVLTAISAFGLVKGGGSSQKSFCKAAVADYNKWQKVGNSDSGVSASTQHKVLNDFKKLANRAPKEIKADMQFEAHSVDNTLGGNGDSVDTTALSAANERVTSYLNQHCGGGIIDFSN